MKIKGQVPEARPNELMVIPRPNGGIPFEAKPLHDWDEFNKLVQAPAPPVKLTKDGKQLDFENAGYRQQVANYNDMQSDYMVIVSLEPSEIEWEKVNIDEPKTWKLWRKELEDAGFTLAERGAIFQLALRANMLDEEMMKQARADFVAGQAAALEKSLGQSTAPAST